MATWGTSTQQTNIQDFTTANQQVLYNTVASYAPTTSIPQASIVQAYTNVTGEQNGQSIYGTGWNQDPQNPDIWYGPDGTQVKMPIPGARPIIGNSNQIIGYRLPDGSIIHTDRRDGNYD